MLTVIDNFEVNHQFEAEWCENEGGVLIVMKENLPVAAFNIGQWRKWFINAETVRQEK